MSPMFIGKTIEAVYHSSIVVYGTEFFYGGGICEGSPKVINIYLRIHHMDIQLKKLITVTPKSQKKLLEII